MANTPHPAPNSCLVLDSAVYTHAAPTLADLRIFDPARHEIPYALTLSGPSSPEPTPATILNQTLSSPARLTFDLQTPNRPYSALDLTLNAHNFLAVAKLTGLRALGDHAPTYLGTFNLYDLTDRNLGQNTHVEFAESTFPYLHLDIQISPITGSVAPRMRMSSPIVSGITGPLALITSATIPPTRQSQTLYTSIATTQFPSQTTTFQLAPHVPVERILFQLDPAETANFNRTVTITAQSSAPNTPAETITGTISRVHINLLGHRIAHESLSIPAILGSNARDAATVTVSIQDDASPHLKLRAVSLEMRQRKLCFPTTPTPTLTYGDPTLTAPAYPYATTFNPASPTQTAALAPERQTLLPCGTQAKIQQRNVSSLHLTLALLGALIAGSALSVRLFKRRSRA